MPKFRQIADDLRSAIQRGEYQPGDQLPTKAALQERYGVAVNTADRAIEELRRLGLAESVQGAGTYVRAPRQPGMSDEYLRLATRLDALEARVGRLEDPPG